MTDPIRILYVEDYPSLRIFVPERLRMEHRLRGRQENLEIDIANNYNGELGKLGIGHDFKEIFKYSRLLLSEKALNPCGIALAIEVRKRGFQKPIVILSDDCHRSYTRRAGLELGLRFFEKSALTNIGDLYSFLMS